jgi:SRSO17 transposase
VFAIDAPEWLGQYTAKMSLSHHQHGLLARYVTGLIASSNKTVSGISSIFLQQSMISMNRLLTEYEWNPDLINMERLEELQRYNETRWNCNGIMIIDDTIVEKYGKKISGVGKLYDHAKGRFVNGHCIVSMYYADEKTNYAIDYGLYLKKGSEGFRTKIEIAGELVTKYNSLIPAQTLVWDSWYTCKQLVDSVEETGKRWIGACRSNLLVWVDGRYVSIEKWVAAIPEKNFQKIKLDGRDLMIYSKSLYIKSLGCEKRVIVSVCRDKNGHYSRLYLLTNRTDSTTNVISDYILRWKIESFHKDAKQHLGLGRAQVRNVEGIRRHWYLVFLAHSLLRLGVSESFFGRSLIRSIGKKARCVLLQLLEEFIAWIMGSTDENRLHKVMEVYLYR